MAISKYGHWRGWASQDWQSPKIIYYNRRIQNNVIFTMWDNDIVYYKTCTGEKCKYVLLLYHISSVIINIIG
jgi:hypothetical protein